VNFLVERETKERTFRIPLTLTPAQASIEKGMKRFTLIRAGRKFGKTKFTLKKILDWLGPPRSCVWYICPTYRQGKLISWAEIKRMIPPEILHKKPNDSDLIITLKNGSELYYMGSDEPNSLRGPEPTGVIFDEAAYHRPDVWEPVIRPNLSVHKAPALFVTSPNGFNWVKDLEDAADLDPEWATFHYTIYDNPYIDRSEIETIRSRCDPRVFRQEYLAEYEASVGRVFGEFQDGPRHVFAFPMPTRSDLCFRSIDWGMRDDTAALWGMLRGQKLYIYRENAANGLAASAQARLILARTPASETIEMSIIGHDAGKTDIELKGLTVQWQFLNAGIRPLRMGSRRKEMFRDLITQLLAQDRLLIHPECKKLRKQLLSYSWKDTAMEKTEDGHDDLVDSLHSMVELLQYRLCLNPRKDQNQTVEELYAEIKEQEKSQRLNQNRYPLTQEPDSSGIFDPVGTPAGYL